MCSPEVDDSPTSLRESNEAGEIDLAAIPPGSNLLYNEKFGLIITIKQASFPGGRT
jgi:hypothetical protein